MQIKSSNLKEHILFSAGKSDLMEELHKKFNMLGKLVANVMGVDDIEEDKPVELSPDQMKIVISAVAVLMSETQNYLRDAVKEEHLLQQRLVEQEYPELAPKDYGMAIKAKCEDDVFYPFVIEVMPSEQLRELRDADH